MPTFNFAGAELSDCESSALLLLFHNVQIFRIKSGKQDLDVYINIRMMKQHQHRVSAIVARHGETSLDNIASGLQ